MEKDNQVYAIECRLVKARKAPISIPLLTWAYMQKILPTRDEANMHILTLQGEDARYGNSSFQYRVVSLVRQDETQTGE